MPADQFELLVEFTKDEDPKARAMAIAGLAKLRNPRGFAPVVVTLFDPVDEVRAVAATALGVFADDRAFEPLVECLNDPSEQVAVNCAWAFGQIPTKRCLDKLLELIADSQAAPAVRAAAATAVGERSELPGSDIATSDAIIERVRVVLLDAFEEDADDLRAAAVWAAGHLPYDKQTLYACIDLLEDEHEWVVRYAIEALAQFKDRAAIEPLEELADSDNEAIRDLAQRALEMIG